MSGKPRLILASASPRRSALLRRAGWSFRRLSVEIDERPRPKEGARAYVLRLAREKAEAAAAKAPTARLAILAADTTVEYSGKLLGKPASPRQAQAMLRRLSGRRHRVWTGLALYDPEHERGWQIAIATRVWMRRWTAAEISAYVAGGEPMDKAGAYAIQGGAAGFITRLEGDYDNVVGLPLAGVGRLWRARQSGIGRTIQAHRRWISL